MVTVLDAVYDGVVFHPSEPVSLQPNTHVRITIEFTPAPALPAKSFLKIARSIQVEGPADWSSNVDGYLYQDIADKHEE